MSQKALRWRATGPEASGARPVLLYRMLPSQQVKVLYSDGTFARYRCWQCALSSKNVELIDDAPTRVLVPDNF